MEQKRNRLRINCGKSKEAGKEPPSWAPPPWIIPLIDKGKKKKKGGQPQPVVEVPQEPPPSERNPDELPGGLPPQGDRGVAILDL